MSRHPAQQTNYRSSSYPSPFERQTNGKYLIEKLVDPGNAQEPQWIVMSYGDADNEAPSGKELDRLIQRAEVLEGRVRIRRSRGDVIVWDSATVAQKRTPQLESA